MLQVGPGEALIDRTELAPARGAGRGSRDDRPPHRRARASTRSRRRASPSCAASAPPFNSTFRPQEALTAQVLAGAVRAVDALAPDAVIQGGDLIDNAQANELAQALALLRGGRVDPDSGGPGYVGVQSAPDPDPLLLPPRHRRPAPPRPARAGHCARSPRSGLHAPVAPGARRPRPPRAGRARPVAADAARSRSASAPSGTCPLNLTRRAAHRHRHRHRHELPGRPVGPGGDRRADRPAAAGPVGGRRGRPPRARADRRRGDRAAALPAAAPAGAGAAARLQLRRRRARARDRARPRAPRRRLGRARPRRPARRGSPASSRAPAIAGCSSSPTSRSTSTEGGERLLALLDRHPRVLAALWGHTHRNRIVPRPSPAGGYWLIATCSLIDYPQQLRALRLRDASGGGGVLETWMLDHVPDGGGIGDISRELVLHRRPGRAPPGLRRRAARPQRAGCTRASRGSSQPHSTL